MGGRNLKEEYCNDQVTKYKNGKLQRSGMIWTT
jgi:hypothetical protein